MSQRENILKDVGNLSRSMRLQQNQMDKVQSVHKMTKSKEKEWTMKSEAKNIRDILGDLNGKLKRCRMKYNRDLRTEA